MTRAVIIGPPAAGKSKLGRRLAAALDVDFVDTDKRVVAEHGPITEIFDQWGEPEFRRLERVAVVQALREDAVVSLGGGAVLHPDTQADLAEHRVLLLTISAEAVASRTSLQNGKRPLLRNGIEAWQKLVAERMPLYQRLADGVIDTSSGHMENVLQEALEWVQLGAGK